MDPSRPPIEELLRRLGRAAIFREAEAHGLSPRGNRIRCPFKGCQDAGPGRERDAQVYEGGHPRVWCFRCGTRGDYLDLLQATRGWTAAQAVAHVQGLEVPTGPVLAVVPPPPPPDEGKLPPAEVQRLWDALALDDADGRAYLEGRHLADAIEAGLVRFATPDAKASQVAYLGRRGYRAAALVSDVTGAPRGIQVRLCRDAMAKEVKVMSVKGSATGRAFFGQPGLIEASPVVVVAEGLADTLAASLWAGDAAVVVGAAGKGALPRLADELEAAGIGLEGKVFALLPQNDRPLNKSRREFARLAQRLGQLKATVAWVATPDEFKDLAEWRQAKPGEVWPPAGLRRALEPTEDTPPEDTLAPLEGGAVPVPGQLVVESLGQDLATLGSLLDGPDRETLLGPGELTWCLMTNQPRVGGRALKAADYTALRVHLESFRTSSSNKPLRFSSEDVREVLALVAQRRQVHPVKDWLKSLRWDRVPRLVGLAQALGLEADSFEALLLRRWLIGAVSRAMTPGRKMDTVLVLVGPQGVGKSTFFSTLAGPDWHTDSRVDVADKDGKMVMREVWVVEWAELDSMRRARDQEAIKAFLTSQVDVFRLPYARDIIKAPRHCVIVGTTNNAEFLFDSTGSRRFWPVEVHGRIDTDWVHTNRDQLWAEAVEAFDKGDRWWLDQEEAAELAEANRAHEARDSWTDPIADWLEAQSHVAEVTIGQVLAGALERARRDWTRADEMRVGAILHRLGWARYQARREGSRAYVYMRPAP